MSPPMRLAITVALILSMEDNTYRTPARMGVESCHRIRYKPYRLKFTFAMCISPLFHVCLKDDRSCLTQPEFDGQVARTIASLGRNGNSVFFPFLFPAQSVALTLQQNLTRYGRKSVERCQTNGDEVSPTDRQNERGRERGEYLVVVTTF